MTLTKNISIFIIFASILALPGCATKVYENTVFPSADAKWKPINPEHFNKSEAQRIYEGRLAR